MSTIQTTVNFSSDSKILTLISGKTFKNDKDFLETLEDYLFGKILINSEEKKYVLESEIFNILDKNIGK